MQTVLNPPACKEESSAEVIQPNTPTQTSNKTHSTFTKRQKWLLVCLSAVAATFSGLASNIYFPALPAIAADLNVSVTMVNLTITTYMLFQGIAPSIWGGIADVKGRRVTYILTFVIFLGACIGLARTPHYAALLVLRCLQSTGSASTIAIGSAVIGDITTREERGGYMGVFQAGLLVPLAAGPIVGGGLAHGLGWRSIFWFLTIYSALFLLVLLLGFPETLRSIAGNGSRVPKAFIHRYPLALYQRYQQTSDGQGSSNGQSDNHDRPKSIDFTAPFRVLISQQAAPVIIFLSIYYAVWQMSITVMSTLFSNIYHLNETAIGLTFIGNGVGSIIGTLVNGKLLDVHYRRVKAEWDSCSATESQQDDFPIERARLRLIPLFALLQCASIIVFGWTLHYHVHIAFPITSTFFTGWMAVSIQSTITTYLVDVFHERSASAGAALNMARCLMGAAGTAVANPLIQAVGIGFCFTILTACMLLGLVLVAIQTWLGRRARRGKAG